MLSDSPSSFDPDLLAWLGARGLGRARAEAMSGDVSVRRYLRLRRDGDTSAILVLYPEAIRGVCARFRRTTALLESVGVPVPPVLAESCERGWMLVEDVGEKTVYDFAANPWSELESWFAEAVRLIERIQRVDREVVASLNPPLDAALLRGELERTVEFFLAPRGFLREPTTASAAASSFDTLCARLGEAEPVVCPRDYMARNLIPEASGNSAETPRLWVLDHQDLRLGPPGYDLASLLNDSLFPPPAVEARLIASAASIDPEAFHRIAAQRTLKAVGTYAAFAARGNPRHLPLIGPTFARALHHLERVPEGSAVAPLLRTGAQNSIC